MNPNSQPTCIRTVIRSCCAPKIVVIIIIIIIIVVVAATAVAIHRLDAHVGMDVLGGGGVVARIHVVAEGGQNANRLRNIKRL